ncbi:hypothetical protein [Aestuariibaculum marinum]|uniref:Uncharacterized protein n=1 Tax=Aestuariibaculum marinum TaxID=2683592 RepID=A0A8J6U2S4_9FLAO|nr:hypothetical protein [Aestuariibaculum marinum]MBD0822627.1 hypothetical protein [Aestuariibaculum marinum]
MIKSIKIFFIKLKWVLFGKQSLKEVVKDINQECGIKPVKQVKKFKVSNAHYASTKRFKV